MVPPPMPEDAHVAVLPLDFGFGHVAHAAEQLHRLIRHPLAGFDGGVLGEADLGDEVRLASQLPLHQVTGVHPGHVDAARHLGQRVLHRLPRDQRPAEGLPVATPLDGEVEAALRTGVGLRGEAHPLGDERGGDLQETGVLRPDQVGDRHPHVGVGQTRRCPTSASPSSPACG